MMASNFFRRLLHLPSHEQRDRLDCALARAEERITSAHVAGVREYERILCDPRRALEQYASDMGVKSYMAEMLRVRVLGEEAR